MAGTNTTGVNDDVFGYKRNPKPHGVFSTENSKLTFGDVQDPVGWLVQNWNISYAQQVQELFEIGSNALYWAKGRPTGQGSLSRIVGDPSTSITYQSGDQSTNSGSQGGFFPSSAYDICQGGATMVLTAQGGHCDLPNNGSDPIDLNQALNITMSGVVVTSIGFSMAVADVKLIEGFTWSYAYLKMDGSGTVT